MDRKQWGLLIEQAIDNYREAVAAQTWPAGASVEDHVVEFAQQLADVGRRWLA